MQRPALGGVRQRAFRRRANRTVRQRSLAFDAVAVGQGARHHPVQPMAGGIGHQQRTVGIAPQRGRPREPRRIRACEDARVAIGRELQHAAGREFADVELPIGRGGQRDHTPRRNGMPGRWLPGVHHARGIEAAHCAVAGIGDPQVAVAGQRQCGGRIEACRDAGSIDVRRSSATGQRAHLAVGPDDADAIVPGIGHVHAPGFVHGDTHRRMELRRRGIAIAEARAAVARQRGHHAVGRDLADGVVAGIGDVEVAVAIDGERRRGVETRLIAAAICEAFRRTCERGDDAIGRDAADAVGLATIADEQAAVGRAHQAPGLVEARGEDMAVARAAVAVAGQQVDARVPVERRGRDTRLGHPRLAPPLDQEGCRQRQQYQYSDGNHGAARARPRGARGAAVQSSTRQNTALR